MLFRAPAAAFFRPHPFPFTTTTTLRLPLTHSRAIMSDIAAATKKQRLEKQVLTVHSGTFHADEALSVALLRQLPRFADAELRRSRDPAVWDQSTVVIDVGAEYDPARNRFDHHQRGFSEVFGHGFTTKLSSAGLIYKCVPAPSLSLSRATPGPLR